MIKLMEQNGEGWDEVAVVDAFSSIQDSDIMIDKMTDAYVRAEQARKKKSSVEYVLVAIIAMIHRVPVELELFGGVGGKIV